MASRLWKKVLLSFLFLCLAGASAHVLHGMAARTSTASFGMDESDYTCAARLGYAASYLDRPSISFPGYVRLGLQHGFHSDGFSKLSDFIRESGDVTFFRHYHGPLFFYALSTAQDLGIGSEKGLRIFSWIVGLLSGGALAFAYRQASPQPSRYRTALLAFLPALSPTVFLACANITPHVLFLPIACAALGAFSMFLNRPSRKAWFLVCVLCALALATFEYTPMLVLGIAAAAATQRAAFATAFGNRPFLKAVGLFLLVQLAAFPVLWIGGLAKLTVIKDYLFFAYFVLLRKDAFGDSSFTDVWLMRFSESPVEWGIAFLALLLGVLRWRSTPSWRHHTAFVVLIVLATLRNRWPYPQYVVAMMPSVFLMFALSLEALWKKPSFKDLSFLLVAVLMAVGAERFLFSVLPTSQQTVNHPFSSGDAVRKALLGTGATSIYAQNYVAATIRPYASGRRIVQLRAQSDTIETTRLREALPTIPDDRIAIAVAPGFLPAIRAAIDSVRFEAHVVRLDSASTAAPVCLALRRRFQAE